MPAYFTMEVAFKKNTLYECFVRDVYDIFYQFGFKFKCGFWYGKDMSFEEIIDWNQKHLQNKIERKSWSSVISFAASIIFLLFFIYNKKKNS